VHFAPFDGYYGEADTAGYLRKLLEDTSSGLDLPAAMILETVQAEGGVNIASNQWLQDIEQICRDFDILLIIDDIQVGNGRTGPFFSFEEAGINPDIITLSKSIGGGLPLAIILMKNQYDQWKPGEHTGTFRGNNLAFVASTKLLSYWETDNLTQAVHYKEEILKEKLNEIIGKYDNLNASIRGKGLIYGLQIPLLGFCSEVSTEAFNQGLLIELAGSNDDVLKFLPPLTIEKELLIDGLKIIDESIETVLNERESIVEGNNHDSENN
jgi:diaminobutyrate-2-oxoglutarate transaminase